MIRSFYYRQQFLRFRQAAHMFCRATSRGASGVASSVSVQRPGVRCWNLNATAQQTAHRHLQRRSASTWQGFRRLYSQEPLKVTLALILIAGSGGFLLYSPFWYEKYLVRPYHNFPEEVAKELRKALYYQNAAVEPKQAFVHYKRALQVAEEIGMDPFSPEILGTKIKLAAFLEQYYDYQAAISVLGIVRSDCVKWERQYGDKHHLDGKRTRILETAVKASIKMGELYGLPHVGENEKAEEALTWGVDTALREGKRREAEGVKDGEGEWLNNEAMGGSMESLAHLYETKGMPHLAAPLFLKALTLCPSDTCHAALLMNNLASAFAAEKKAAVPVQKDRTSRSLLSLINPRAPPPGSMQQAMPLAAPSGPSFAHHDSARASTLPTDANAESFTPAAQASSWARLAVSTADAVPLELRNDECAQAKCAALYNLGELAERQGSQDFAVEWYRQASSLAKTINFEEGVKMANEGLTRLKS